MLLNSAILEHKLRARLAEEGKDFDSLLKNANEIVVFGSCTPGLDMRDSDIDVLVSGIHFMPKCRNIDFICIDNNHLLSSEWLSSELASHVVRYGVWLRGEGAWKPLVRIGATAQAHKARRISRISRALFLRWPHVHPLFRRQYALSIRREIQRLVLLRGGRQIPPGRILDRLWSFSLAHRLRVAQCIETLPLSEEAAVFLTDLTKFRLAKERGSLVIRLGRARGFGTSLALSG
jgi:predicted nucleotidyltransferase